MQDIDLTLHARGGGRHRNIRDNIYVGGRRRGSSPSRNGSSGRSRSHKSPSPRSGSSSPRSGSSSPRSHKSSSSRSHKYPNLNGVLNINPLLLNPRPIILPYGVYPLLAILKRKLPRKLPESPVTKPPLKIPNPLNQKTDATGNVYIDIHDDKDLLFSSISYYISQTTELKNIIRMIVGICYKTDSEHSNATKVINNSEVGTIEYLKILKNKKIIPDDIKINDSPPFFLYETNQSTEIYKKRYNNFIEKFNFFYSALEINLKKKFLELPEIHEDYKSFIKYISNEKEKHENIPFNIHEYYKNKYLKYKNKYIQLKNKISN